MTLCLIPIYRVSRFVLCDSQLSSLGFLPVMVGFDGNRVEFCFV